MSGLEALLNRTDEIKKKRIVVGYDGFVDTTVRPISQAATHAVPAKMFETIRDFGEFLISKAEKSCSIELEVESRHLGGNLPFLSRGASSLGLDVTCIGMLGEGENVEEPFRELPCTLYPFAPSGKSTCLEFRDGKVMLAPTCSLPRDGWSLVMEATGGQAPLLFEQSDLFALVNWSELSFAQDLWTATYQHTLKNAECDKKRFAFFDLSDISRKTGEEIRSVLQLIQQFSQRRTTILSLNENEALAISDRVMDNSQDLQHIGLMLRDIYEIDQILVHTLRHSILICSQGIFSQSTDFVENPVISTGAGDHFNAASCFAAVMGFQADDRLQFANRAASFYVSKGYSPNLEEIVSSFSTKG